MTREDGPVLDRLLADGYATVTLTGSDRESLRRARLAAYEFFRLPDDAKLRYMSADFHFGFRPRGLQHSVDPQRPDLNESFAYWSDAVDRIPEGHLINPLITAVEAFRRVLARVGGAALDALVRHYDYPRRIAFEQASCIELNWYLAGAGRELLQDRHEDGHLFTVLTADAPGLEIEVAGRMLPVEFPDGRLLLMPGGLLSDMTGGAVPPLFHQVRNLRLPSRLSFLYQVNPQSDGFLAPFVVSDQNREADIAARAREVGRSFGLPPAPIV